MLELPDAWVWDSWLATDDDGLHHLFFLRASRALLDPERRHDHASVGHAVSRDLRAWELVADALVPADSPAWDDKAIWTGSVVRAPDGTWRLFYTGRSRGEDGRVQRIGVAASDDLYTWERRGLLLEADPHWYETGAGTEVAWRDPCVIADPEGDGWHMFITARANAGAQAGRGVIAHARSADLETWEAGPPLTAPAGFWHVEVPRPAVIDGRPLLLFCCQRDHLAPGRSADGGAWVAPGASLTGPWDLERATVLDHPSLYAANFVRDGDGWAVLGFREYEHGAFVGAITDPLPIEPHGDTVRLADQASTGTLPQLRRKRSFSSDGDPTSAV